MNFHEHKAMLAALQAGTATPEQQAAAFTHIEAIRKQHAQEAREAAREASDAYHEGRANAAQDARGEPYGTY